VVKLGGGPAGSPLPHLWFEIPTSDDRPPTSDFGSTSFYAEITWILCLLKCTIWLISTFPRLWKTYSLVVSNLGIPQLWLGNLTTGSVSTRFRLWWDLYWSPCCSVVADVVGGERIVIVSILCSYDKWFVACILIRRSPCVYLISALLMCSVYLSCSVASSVRCCYDDNYYCDVIIIPLMSDTSSVSVHVRSEHGTETNYYSARRPVWTTWFLSPVLLADPSNVTRNQSECAC